MTERRWSDDLGVADPVATPTAAHLHDRTLSALAETGAIATTVELLAVAARLVFEAVPCHVVAAMNLAGDSQALAWTPAEAAEVPWLLQTRAGFIIDPDELPTSSCARIIDGDAQVGQGDSTGVKEFERRAAFIGVHSYVAVDLRTSERNVADAPALIVIRTESVDWRTEEIACLEAMAVAVRGELSRRAAVRAALERARQLEEALTSRVAIEQAKGFVMAKLGIGADNAFAILRTYSRRHRRRLVDVAGEIVDRRLAPIDLTSSDRSPHGI